MLHRRGLVRQGQVFHGLEGQELVQFAEPFVVAGQADIEEAVVAPEFDACDRFDIPFVAGHHKIHDAGRVVDIGEGEGPNAQFGGHFRQAFHGHCTVAQGVI